MSKLWLTFLPRKAFLIIYYSKTSNLYARIEISTTYITYSCHFYTTAISHKSRTQNYRMYTSPKQ